MSGEVEAEANLGKNSRQIYCESLSLLDKIFKIGIDHRSPTPDLRTPEAIEFKKIVLNAIKSREIGNMGVDRDIQNYVEKLVQNNSQEYLKKHPGDKPADEAARLHARAPDRRAAVITFLNFIFSK